MNKTKQKLKDQEIILLPKKVCIYCEEISFGQYHIECYRMITHLSTKDMTEKEKREYLKKLTIQRELDLINWEKGRLKY